MYTTQNFDNLLGTAGFSDGLLKDHFTLYQAYVANTNKLQDKLDQMSKAGKTKEPEFAELKRRFGWEWNGMRLHEYYFSNLTKKAEGLPENSPLLQKINQNFGHYQTWLEDFRGVGSIRGIGWAVLYHDPQSGQLFNVWINEHHQGHLADCRLLLIMDVFEHAYMRDYGLKRADYIEAFLKAIDWGEAEKRYATDSHRL